MICPICKNPVPFGLQMHMLAAHGAKSAQYLRESERIEQQLTAKPKDRGRGRRRQGKPGAKGQLKHPRLSKLS